jgi:hypothetical protein
MTKVHIGWFLGALFVVPVILFYAARGASTEPADLPAGERATGTAAEPASEQFRWIFTDLGTDPQMSVPRTKVALERSGTIRDIGTYDGSCTDIADSSWQLLSGEIAGTVCWFAGGGSEIGLFEENGAVVAKQGDLSEGDSETPGFRGNFRTLFEISERADAMAQ